MPFITEELWSATETDRQTLLALAEWPNLIKLENELALDEGRMEVVLDTVNEVRSIRTNYSVPAKERLTINLSSFSPSNTAVLNSSAESIERLANTEVQFTAVTNPSESFIVRAPVKEGELFIYMPPSFDPNRERERLLKEIEKITKEIGRFEQKLRNAEFLDRAPEEVVEGEREKLEEAEFRKARLCEALQRIQRT